MAPSSSRATSRTRRSTSPTGAWYLRYLLDRYEGNTVAAVAAYNAGHGRVDEWGGKDLTVEDIRFPETVDYTSDVIDKRGEYGREYRHRVGLR